MDGMQKGLLPQAGRGRRRSDLAPPCELRKWKEEGEHIQIVSLFVSAVGRSWKHGKHGHLVGAGLFEVSCCTHPCFWVR